MNIATKRTAWRTKKSRIKITGLKTAPEVDAAVGLNKVASFSISKDGMIGLFALETETRIVFPGKDIGEIVNVLRCAELAIAKIDCCKPTPPIV